MVEFTTSQVRVTVPATCANLGPGFDAFGLALRWYDTVCARVVPEPGVHVTVAGEGAGELPADETHLVASSALAAFDMIGARPAGLGIDCVNRIPQARGLGSSSAAIVAGITIARYLAIGDPLDDDAALRLATSIEGHPDNVAPCLLGGFTIAWIEPGTGARAVKLAPSEQVRPVVYVPRTRGLTAQARAALPETVPHRDAAANAGRAGLLVHALTAAPELLLAATEDRLHQDYRAAGAPATAELVRMLRAAGLPAVVSGAGPSVLALVTDESAAPEVAGWFRSTPTCDAMGAQGEVY